MWKVLSCHAIIMTYMAPSYGIIAAEDASPLAGITGTTKLDFLFRFLVVNDFECIFAD